MITIKSFTDLPQSKILSTILPLESADMYWIKRHMTFIESKYEVFVIDKSNKYIDFFKSYAIAVENKDIIPCWSLAALLEALPKIVNHETLFIETSAALWHIGYRNIYTARADNLVDACYEMIIKLHELKML